MTELLAIVMSQRLISAAAERIYSRHQRPPRVEIDLGQRKCSFACSTDDETTVEALRQQADKLTEQLADKIDDQTTQQRDELRRRGIWRMTVAAVISVVLVVTALVSGPVTSVLGIFILAVAIAVLGYAALDRFVRLRGRMAAVIDNGSQEKNNLTHTLIQVGDELATLFSQERRSRDLLPGLQDYLLGLTADHAHRAIRITAPPRPDRLCSPVRLIVTRQKTQSLPEQRTTGLPAGSLSGRLAHRRGPVDCRPDRAAERTAIRLAAGRAKR